MVIVNLSIWSAIANDDKSFGSAQIKLLYTYIILSMTIYSSFTYDDYFIEKKVKTGAIVSDLTRPYNFYLNCLFYNLGTNIFRLALIYIPFLLVFYGLGYFSLPFSLSYFVLFLLSLLIGYFVLFNLCYIVWLSAFWIKRTFSAVTIKDVAISILSGAIIPLWYMPERLQKISQFTPFQFILYKPILLYLGQIPKEEVREVLILQVSWLMVLFLLGQVQWYFARKKMDIQGG